MNNTEFREQMEAMIKNVAGGMSEKEKVKFQKVMDIVDATIHAATVITKEAPIAFPRRKLFNHKDRKHRMRRAKKQRAKFNFAMAIFMGRVQIEIAMSKPISNFIPGGIAHGPAAIIGDGGPEIVLSPDGSISLSRSLTKVEKAFPDGVIFEDGPEFTMRVDPYGKEFIRINLDDIPDLDENTFPQMW